MSSMEEIEEEAKAAAQKMVMNMMQRPGQLEKVEQYKKRITHKKASIEAQLKSAVQGQLDGVSVGLKQLQECLDDVSQINVKMEELECCVRSVPPLVASLQAVREEESRHSQYVTAMDSLKHIFTVPESVNKAKQWIGEGKLLHAHQCLTDLENSRDDLLYELHRLPNQSSHDKIMLKAYFEDVESVSHMLEKQIKMILSRTLNTVRKEPTVIVTALRIIEREEKRDLMALQQQSQTGFMPPGRPKSWRSKGFEVLEASVSQRIQGTRVNERENDKQWLVKYLELTRQLILEDLRVVKTLCVPCFPPTYDIVNKYVDMYHKCLGESLLEVISCGLENNEDVCVLSWVLSTYPGPDLMRSPDLALPPPPPPPLLPAHVLDKLQDDYLQRMRSNLRVWLEKTVSVEQAAWRARSPPERAPHDHAWGTHAPLTVHSMIHQHLQVTSTMSAEMCERARLVAAEEMARFADNYADAVKQYKISHFMDRSVVPYFTQHMITIVNNAAQLASLASHAPSPAAAAPAPLAPLAPPAPPAPALRAPLAAAQAKAQELFMNLRDEAARFLLEEAFLDLEVHFEDLFTAKWVSSSIPIDTICVTLEDYFQDYNHLREKNYEYVINEAQNMVCKKYVTALLSKRMAFKSVEEAQEAAAKIKKEAAQIKAFFKKIAPEGMDVVRLYEVICSLAEVLGCSEAEMLALDLHACLDKCPGISGEQLRRLLWLRQDIRQEARQCLDHVLAQTRPHKEHHTLHAFFQDITFTERLLGHFAL